MNTDLIQRIMESRKRLIETSAINGPSRKQEEEGGCGVVGFCCTEPVPGRHIYAPSVQMHNRGNGKGGGVAAVGFIPEQLGVSRAVLDECYLLHIALLDPSVRDELERKYIAPNFDIEASGRLDTVDDWQSVKGLDVKPPDVWRYFVRVKRDVLKTFVEHQRLTGLDTREAED